MGDPSVNSAWLLPILLLSNPQKVSVSHMLQLKYFTERFNSKQKEAGILHKPTKIYWDKEGFSKDEGRK